MPAILVIIFSQLNTSKTMKERMFPRTLQRAAVWCEAVRERDLTASGVGFVNGFSQ